MKKTTVIFPRDYPKRDNTKQHIYDTFNFFNEVDLLEIRLSELSDIVDYFVICEANSTHAGKPKPFYFEESRAKFKKWEKKIIYVKVYDMPKLNLLDNIDIYLEKNLPQKLMLIVRRTAMRIPTGEVGLSKLEHYQIKQIYEGLRHCKDKDIVFFGGLDEIPRKETMTNIRELFETNKHVQFEQNRFCFFLNGKAPIKDFGTKGVKFSTLKENLHCHPYYIRDQTLNEVIKRRLGGKNRKYFTIHNAGWHFTSMGNIAQIMKKYEALCHPELRNYLDPEKIKNMIEKGIVPEEDYRLTYVKIDNSFPEVVYNNKKKYGEFIKTVHNL